MDSSTHEIREYGMEKKASEFKGTPGPWVVGYQSIGEVSAEDDTISGIGWHFKNITISGPEGSYLCDVKGMDTGSFARRDRVESNAQLIAAAPELLEALQLLLSQIPSDLRKDWLYGECKKAKDAIAKALGKEVSNE